MEFNDSKVMVLLKKIAARMHLHSAALMRAYGASHSPKIFKKNTTIGLFIFETECHIKEDVFVVSKI